MSDDFQGKRVVVTGGTGSLGQAVVRHLVDHGARVAIPVQKQSHIDGFELREHTGVTLDVVGDIAAEGVAEAFYKQHASGLWASVHVAGGFAYSPVADAGLDLFEQQMRMNAVTCYACCRQAIQMFRDTSTAGRIVNVAAKPALFPHEGANMAAYTASKAAVAGLTGALGEEVKADGIWVNAVVPSIMDTPANRSAMPDADHDQWPTVDQVAETICWLASPLNKVTRGGLVPVYGKS